MKTTSIKRVAALAVFLCSIASFAGEEIGIKAEVLAIDSRGHVTIRVTNVSSKPISAYLGFFSMRKGRTATQMFLGGDLLGAEIMQQEYPARGGFLLPGQFEDQQSAYFDRDGTQNLSVRCVIYADRTAEGDSGQIRRFLQGRLDHAIEIRKALEIVKAKLADSNSTDPLGESIKELKAIVDRWLPGRVSGGDAPSRPDVGASEVLNALQARTHTREDLSALIVKFEGYASQFELHSRLATDPPPAK